MDVLLIILGITLAVVFFINMHRASLVLCRIICAFLILFLYNAASPLFGFPLLGINLLTAAIISILGIPGGIMLICANILL